MLSHDELVKLARFPLIRREPLPRKSCALGHGAWLSNTGRTPQSSGSHRILARYPLIRKKSER